MRKLLTFVLFAFCLSSSLAFARDHNFQAGKLINVTTDERMDEGTSIRRAIFIVQIGDIVYTLQGDRVRPRDKDYAQGLIMGDNVQASIEGESVILQRPNGKDFKTSILKRERTQTK